MYNMCEVIALMVYPKGKPKSEESKRKASESGKAAWTTEMRAERSEKYRGEGNPFHGRTHSEETRQRLSERVLPPASEETRRKISSSLLGNSRAKGNRYRLSTAQRDRLSRSKMGPVNHFWKGGITPEHTRIRMSAQYRQWRTAVFERDEYTCLECGARNGNGVAVALQADHIKPFALFPGLRFDLDNGRTLCVPCHRKTPTYGWSVRYGQVV
jgi:hypothetical protein